MPRREPRREEPLVPVAGDDAPAIARQFVGEVLPVAGAEDLRARVVPETPAGKATEAKCDFRWRGGTLMISRLIRPSRTAASADGRPLRTVPGIAGHDLGMPVHHQAGARVEPVEGGPPQCG